MEPTQRGTRGDAPDAAGDMTEATSQPPILLVQDASLRYQETSGGPPFDAEHVLGRTDAELWGPAGEAVAALKQAVLAGGPPAAADLWLTLDEAPRCYRLFCHRLPGDGEGLLTLAEDVTAARDLSRRAARAQRALRTLSEANQALIRSPDEDAVLGRICRAAVEQGGYAMAWVGFARHDADRTVQPVAQAGFEQGYLESSRFSWADNEYGRGPTGTSIREGRPVILRDTLSDPAYQPWRERAVDRGYRSSIGLPLLADGQAFGALSIYATEADAFDADELALLVELADDLAFALGTQRVRAERDGVAARQATLLRGLQTVVAISDELLACPSLDELCRLAVELIRERLGLDRCALLLVEDETTLRGTFGTDHEGRTTDERALRLARQAFRPGPGDADAPHPRWACHVPITAGGSVLGLLCHDNALAGATLDPARAEVLVVLGVLLGRLIDLRRAQDELRESEGRLRTVVHQAPLVLLSLGADGRIGVAAGLGLQALGRAPEALVGQELAALAPDSPALPALARRALAGEVVVDEVELGGCLLRLYGCPVGPSERRSDAAIVVAIDITAQARLEVQLRQSQKMEAIGRLAGGVAHDFNNHLGVIRGYCELLGATLAESDARHADVDAIVAAVDRSTTLTRRLLAFSRRELLELRPVAINEFIARLVDLARRMIPEHIELVLEADPAAGYVTADEGQLEQVLMNLVVNARDAMPEGGRLRLATTTTEADLPHLGRRRYEVITVTDTGCGMDEETRARVFEPFFTTKPANQGTGLGLSTSYGIIAQLGGDIQLDSRPGEGATFRLYLPTLTDLGGSAEAAAPAGALDSGQATILVVEDEESIRHLACRVLERAGYEVLEADGPLAALALVEARPAPIHLLLSDVVMPHLSGPQLAERLAPLRPDMHILFMSGYADQALAACSASHRDRPLLAKPFRVTELLEAVRAALEGRAPADAGCADDEPAPPGPPVHNTRRVR